MAAVTKEIHLIGGIQINVYKPNIQAPSVAILFLLHGRTQSVKSLDVIARSILEKNEHGKLWIVTFVTKKVPFFFESYRQVLFRIIAIMDIDLWTYGPTMDGPRKSVTPFMRMFIYYLPIRREFDLF